MHSPVRKHVRSSPPAPPRAQPAPDPEAALVQRRIVPVYAGVGFGRAVCGAAGAALYPSCKSMLDVFYYLSVCLLLFVFVRAGFG